MFSGALGGDHPSFQPVFCASCVLFSGILSFTDDQHRGAQRGPEEDTRMDFWKGLSVTLRSRAGHFPRLERPPRLGEHTAQHFYKVPRRGGKLFPEHLVMG